MTDRREEILKASVLSGAVSNGEVHCEISEAKNAMDEYFTERALELLEYIAKNNVQSTWYMGDDGERRYIFVYNREDITKEQLFNNFL